ncbi:MAG: hypothetical protein NT069_08280, partial [Planctomycetota bacterium]|nr:hypothetical protein [Planctomycetota bacterium]
LDRKPHPLYRFVERICRPLGLSLQENVYATNACKNFFFPRPNAIKRRDKVDVIARSWNQWRELLLLELARFPDAIVCTLGQPILRLLLKPGQPRNLGHYWGMTEYYTRHQSRRFRCVEAEASSIGRRFVPLYHLYSTGVQYFRTFRRDYLSVVRGQWSVAGRSGESDG